MKSMRGFQCSYRYVECSYTDPHPDSVAPLGRGANDSRVEGKESARGDTYKSLRSPVFIIISISSISILTPKQYFIHFSITLNLLPVPLSRCSSPASSPLPLLRPLLSLPPSLRPPSLRPP